MVISAPSDSSGGGDGSGIVNDGFEDSAPIWFESVTVDGTGSFVPAGGGKGGIECVRGSIFGKKLELISPMPTKKSSGERWC